MAKKNQKFDQPYRVRQEPHLDAECLAVMLNSIGDGVIAADRSGVVTSLNAVAESITGCTAAEAVGQPVGLVLKSIDDVTRQPVENLVSQSLGEGAVVGLANHAVLVGKDGTERTIDSSAAPVRDAHGNIHGVVLVFRDVTQRRKAEAAARESEARRAAILEMALDSIITIDHRGRIVEFNPASERTFGFCKDEVLGQPMAELIVPPHQREQYYQGLANYLAKGEGPILHRPMEMTALRADGTEFPVELTVTPISLDGRLLFTAYLRDISVRKMAEASLRASEHRFRTLANHAPVGIFQTDPQGDCLFVNHRWCAMAGLTPEEAQGRGWIQALHPEDRERVFREWYDAAQAGREFDSDYRFQTPDQKVIWLQGHAVALRDEAGRVTGYLGTISDITERKRTADILRESEERFRQLAESINEVFWVSDLQKKEVEYVSPAYEQIWGRSRQSLYERPRSFLDAIHSNDRNRVLTESVDRQADGESSDVEYRVVRPDGSLRWVRDRSFPVKDQAGRVYRMVGIAEDITERKQAEDTVRALLGISERLNSALNVDILLDLLVQEAIQLVNAESGVAGLYTPQGMVCRKYFQRGKVIPWEYCWPPMHGLPGWLIVHKVPYLTNVALTDTQIGRELCARLGVRSALSTPILNAQGEVLGFFEIHNKGGGFTASDQKKVLAVSHTASIAIENARLYEESRQSDRRKDEFLAMLAHELRNPLAPIRSGLDLLALGDDRHRETIALMQEQVQHLVRLVDDLLDVSRIMRGKIELRKEAVELSTLVNRSVETIRAQVECHQQELVVTLSEQAIWLNADPVRLVQVIENLLNNAVKYTNAGGQIELTVEREDDQAVIRVRDTGIGIETELLSKIFDLFTQSSRSLDRAQGGLGIGLTLVQRLVEMHGGTVAAHSEGLGHGSTFVLRLPIAEVMPPTERPVATSRGCRSCRILVVDDNVGAARMLSMLLTKLGDHQVETAYDGPSSLAKVKEMHPDIVLLDIGLPGMDGYQVARSVRQMRQFDDVFLVALTGYGQKEDRQRSTEAGFDKHLVKPVEKSALEELLAAFQRPTS